MSQLGEPRESEKIARIAEKAIKAVDQTLWSEEDGCYLDIQETHHIGGPYRTLTQDGSLYVVALTENTLMNDNLKGKREYNIKHRKTEIESRILDQNIHYRANRTLDAIRARTWKEKWPLVMRLD